MHYLFKVGTVFRMVNCTKHMHLILLTLFILLEYYIRIDTISMEYPILNFK